MGSIGGWRWLYSFNCIHLPDRTRSVPYAGLYSTTKWALRGAWWHPFQFWALSRCTGISETLHDEISPLGLRSVCVDFGYFRTSFLESDQRAPKVSRIPDYKETSEAVEAALQGIHFHWYDIHLSNLNLIIAYNGKQPGNPLKGVEVIMDLVHGVGLSAGKPFPRGLALGTDCYNVAKTSSNQALERLEIWKDVSFSTDFKN